MQKILFIGGSGQLGKKMVDVFKGTYSVANIDFTQNKNAHVNYLMQTKLSAKENNKNIIQKLKSKPEKFKAIIVTAGGWTGGNIKDDDYFQKCHQMLNMSLYPALLGAHLSTHYLGEQGFLILTGAAAVFTEPQPEMIAYAVAKTSVHSLALNIAQKAKQMGNKVITILPQTLDTQSNRISMPTADFSKWSKPEQIGELVKGWVDGLNVPNNGSFALLKVKNGSVVPEYV